MSELTRLPVVFALLVAACACRAGMDTLQDQRELFLEARTALLENRRDRYEELARQLRDYPLYAYLEYTDLRARLDRADAGEITRFIETWADQPVSKRLQQAWLYGLGRRGRWELFLKHYTGSSSIELQCYALRARLERDEKPPVSAMIALWLVGKSQPESCDPLFSHLYDNGHITRELLWERITLAMDNNQPSLAGYLARRLPEADAARVTLWRKAHRNPSATLRDPRLAGDEPVVRRIILHALRRLARFDPQQAHERWEALRDTQPFTAEQRASVERYIALSAAQQHLPAAHEWLAGLPEDARDGRVREWQVRAALENRDWPAVSADIRAMPADERDADEWRYWLAAALQRSGDHLQAMNHYAQLARERSYHGFLAADFLDWPYEMGNTPLEYDPGELERVASRPGLVRARELYLAGMTLDARREWAYATQGMTPAELKLAAILAGQWGWNDNAILTVAQSGDYADLKLRFPLDHAASVQRHAARNDLDPAYVFAVIRQESAFNKDATSPAGARGLMQLMPATGRITARELRIPWPGTRALFDTDRNIQLGTRYLRQVMDRYDNNMVLATASYNAGPHRVRRWLPEDDTRAADVWAATIPYRETRRYVERVLTYTAIYDWRMERPFTRLAERMPAVHPEDRYARPGS